LLDNDWKNIVEPVMKYYCDVTDGSYIEAKETALVWHYEEADPVFGPRQAKELQYHLRDVLSEEPVYVKSGHQIVEVNPQVRQHLIISRVLAFWIEYHTLIILDPLFCILCGGSYFTFLCTSQDEKNNPRNSTNSCRDNPSIDFRLTRM
jgi:hypothetical protein